MHWWHVLQGWLSVHLGIRAGQGSVWNNFWGAFGSDIEEFGIFGAIFAGYHHLNCPSQGCPRLGKHIPQGTDHKMCRKHYKQITGEDVIFAHIKHLHLEYKAHQDAIAHSLVGIQSVPPPQTQQPPQRGTQRRQRQGSNNWRGESSDPRVLEVGGTQPRTPPDSPVARSRPPRPPKSSGN